MRFIIWWSADGRYADSRSQPRWRGACVVDRRGKFLARYFSRIGRQVCNLVGGNTRSCATEYELSHTASLLIEAIFFFSSPLPPELFNSFSQRESVSDWKLRKDWFYLNDGSPKLNLFWRLTWLPNALWLFIERRGSFEAVKWYVGKVFFFDKSWGQTHTCPLSFLKWVNGGDILGENVLCSTLGETKWNEMMVFLCWFAEWFGRLANESY